MLEAREENIQADYTMHSYNLKTESYSLTDRFSIILGLHKNVLKEDKNWHFFYENEMGDLVRVSEEFSKAVEIYLTERDIKFDIEKFWKEELYFVVENQDYFKQMFHLNSLLAVQYDGDFHSLTSSLYLYIDRYSHSLHNMLGIKLGEKLMESEARNLASASIGRAWYDGYRAYYIRYGKKSGE